MCVILFGSIYQQGNVNKTFYSYLGCPITIHRSGQAHTIQAHNNYDRYFIAMGSTFSSLANIKYMLP